MTAKSLIGCYQKPSFSYSHMPKIRIRETALGCFPNVFYVMAQTP